MMFALAALGVSLLLAGCGSGGDSAASTNPGPETSKPASSANDPMTPADPSTAALTKADMEKQKKESMAMFDERIARATDPAKKAQIEKEKAEAAASLDQTIASLPR